MRLLLDENLSPRLMRLLADVADDVQHVRDVQLASASDVDVWAYAREHDWAIVSKDEDFYQLSLVRGHPPKVIWVRLGNCTTNDVGQVIRRHREDLLALFADDRGSVLILP